MGAGRLSLVALAACASAPQPTESHAGLADRVAADFEKAVLQSRDAYVALFDFVAVGEYEILLHRYDLNGRLPNLEDDQRDQFSGEDGTPYPEARERRNVGNFYPILAQRTVGTGGCSAAPPRTRYGRLLGVFFDPLPDGTPPGYEKLRTDANAWLAKGGVVGVHCTGGQGGLAIVYTARDNARGYDLITIYDD
jgi:hypothetical protein